VYLPKVGAISGTPLIQNCPQRAVFKIIKFNIVGSWLAIKSNKVSFPTNVTIANPTGTVIVEVWCIRSR